MGDRVTVHMTFGGRVTRAAAARLVEQLLRDGFKDGWTEELPTVELLADPSTRSWVAEDVNYANTDAIDLICQAHGISYTKTHEAGGGFPAGWMRLTDGRFEELAMADEEPMIPLSQILKTETLVTGLADLINLAKWATASLPDFEIADDLDTIAA